MVILLKRRILFAWVAVVLVIAFTFTSSYADFSIKDEKDLGEKLTKIIRKEKSIVDDARILAYINRLGKDIVRHAGPTYFDYHFYVVDSETLNAFAAPAGHVFFFTGLITIFDTEAELVAVMAHEIAHVQKRHIARRISQQTKVGIASLAGVLAGILVGGAAGPAIAMGSMASAQSISLKFSREDEEESDRLALRYMIETGYDPHALLSAFKKMRKEKVLEVGVDVPTYFSTHPGLRERTDYLEGVLQGKRYEYKKKPLDEERNTRFKFIKTKILAQYGDLKEAQKIYLQDKSEENDFLLAFGRGILLKRLGRHAEAVEELKKAASMRPDMAIALGELGDAYFASGRLQKAVATLNSALTLDPDDQEIHYSLARCYQEMGDYQSAIEAMEQVKRLDPDFRRIYYELGVLYGQSGRLGDASYFLGRYYYSTGDNEKAEYHLKKALDYYSDRPEEKAKAEDLLSKIEEERKKNRFF